MSSFICDQCGAEIKDSPAGFTTGCPHYPLLKKKAAPKSPRTSKRALRQSNPLSVRKQIIATEQGSVAERSFDTHWRQLGGPELEREVYFHPTVGWRFYRADREARVAVEIQGGAYVKAEDGTVGGRHHRAAGYDEDCLKHNQALALGWLVFWLTPRMITRDPMGNLTPIIRIIAERRRELATIE